MPNRAHAGLVGSTRQPVLLHCSSTLVLFSMYIDTKGCQATFLNIRRVDALAVADLFRLGNDVVADHDLDVSKHLAAACDGVAAMIGRWNFLWEVDRTKPDHLYQRFRNFLWCVPFVGPVFSPRTTLKTPCSRKTHSIQYHSIKSLANQTWRYAAWPKWLWEIIMAIFRN